MLQTKGTFLGLLLLLQALIMSTGSIQVRQSHLRYWHSGQKCIVAKLRQWKALTRAVFIAHCQDACCRLEDFTGRPPPHLLHCLGSHVKPLQVPGVNVHAMLESKLQADRLVLC